MQDCSSSDTLDRLEQAEQLKLQGQYRDALAMLEELLVEDPTNVSALEEVADNELNLNNYARARKAAEQALALDSESYTSSYILGFISCREEQWETALNFLQTANRQKPNNPEILRCLGWTLFMSGKRPQGIVTLERSLNLDASNPLTLCDLGVTYVHVKNFAKARSLFMRALELDPANERAKECVQVVERMERAMRTSVEK